MGVDDHLKTLAARYIRRQIRQLTGQLEGIRKAEDIEFVHRARVASRRLRTGLAVFADLLGPKVKTWRKAIRSAARDLGDARDEDVQIEFLCGVLAGVEDKSLVPGLARVLTRCEKRRAEAQPRILHSLRELLAARTLHEILAQCKAIGVKRDKQAGPPASPAVFAHAEEHILARFDELWAFRDCLAAPDDHQQHHAMRIAAKRLRYTLEIYRTAYGSRLDGVLDVLKQVQSYLGDIHDCDVWVEQVEKVSLKESRRAAAEPGRLGAYLRWKPGFDFLQTDRRAKRQEWFSALAQFWRGLTETGFWDDLTETVRCRPAPPA